MLKQLIKKWLGLEERIDEIDAQIDTLVGEVDDIKIRLKEANITNWSTFREKEGRGEKMSDYETQIENYGDEGDIIVVDAKKLDKLLLHIGGSETELYEDNEDTPIFDTVSDGNYYILKAIGSEVIENGVTKQARAFLKLAT